MGAKRTGSSEYPKTKKTFSTQTLCNRSHLCCCSPWSGATELALWKGLCKKQSQQTSSHSCQHVSTLCLLQAVKIPHILWVHSCRERNKMTSLNSHLEQSQSSTRDKYVVLISDDHSDYSWVFPLANTNVEIASHAILARCSAFGTQRGPMSYRPSHFRNEKLWVVTKGMQTPATLPYPTLHGAMVWQSTSFVKCFALRAPSFWTEATPRTLAGSDTTFAARHKSVAIDTTWTHIPNHSLYRFKYTTPISSFMFSHTGCPVTLSKVARQQSLDVKGLQERMKALHLIVESTLHANHKRAI